MSPRTLYLMLGYPGAGKTTTAKILHELTGAEHIWADHERHKKFKNPTHSHEENLKLYDGLNDLTDQLLSKDKSVIFDTNFNFYKDRAHLRNIAAKYHVRTVLIWVQIPKEIAKDRATHSRHAQRNTYLDIMSSERFERIRTAFEPPRLDENYLALDGTHITTEYVKKVLKV